MVGSILGVKIASSNDVGNTHQLVHRRVDWSVGFGGSYRDSAVFGAGIDVISHSFLLIC
jgi:hypothetical protein